MSGRVAVQPAGPTTHTDPSAKPNKYTDKEHPMSSSIKRVWFITGASSGIGHELARQAINAGEFVVALARNVAQLDDLAGPEQLLPIHTDVCDEAAVQAAVDQAVAKFGRIDVVANNAGYGLFGAVEETSDTEARAIFDTNVFGVLNVLRATLPVLRRQRSGHVLQGSSTFGQLAVAGVGLLAASKYAVEGISDALAPELAPLGIQVTIVEPGYTATAFFANLQAAGATEPDYDQTVRELFKSVTSLPEVAFSSAERAAAGIRAAVDSDEPPLRLALGSSGADAMRAALTGRIEQIDQTTAITTAVDA
jgi:NAD(P)-dependent dehydrogenase (short-subunit alcohol dehydrogenase family)